MPLPLPSGREKPNQECRKGLCCQCEEITQSWQFLLGWVLFWAIFCASYRSDICLVRGNRGRWQLIWGGSCLIPEFEPIEPRLAGLRWVFITSFGVGVWTVFVLSAAFGKTATIVGLSGLAVVSCVALIVSWKADCMRNRHHTAGSEAMMQLLPVSSGQNSLTETLTPKLNYQEPAGPRLSKISSDLSGDRRVATDLRDAVVWVRVVGHTTALQKKPQINLSPDNLLTTGE